MAQVYGFLREDQATHGERAVLKRLRENLPKEYSVYIECPLPARRGHRYPDFIVVTNYGVIVLEVKDWIQIKRADRYRVEIRTRANKSREVENPVNQAREIAILLAGELKDIRTRFKERDQRQIPWGYGVVLPNLGMATITQLRRAWGEEFVLHLDDLDPALIKSRLRVTLPADKMRDLKKYELDYIRATINPTVLIDTQDRAPLILDSEQEQIVSEPVKMEISKPVPTEPQPKQETMFEEEQPDIVKPVQEVLPDIGKRISSNTAIRLVRGVAGSGKTLVLAQRARYLAAQYPEWKICVLTYNKPLQTHLEAALVGIQQVKVYTFHGICRKHLAGYREWALANPEEWLKDHQGNYEIIRELGSDYLDQEFRWMKDTGIMDRDTYLVARRKGRQRQIGQTKRDQIFDLFQDYQSWLDQENKLDWGDLPHLVMQGIDERQIKPDRYDAVLIDEAQDFAPVWIQMVNRLIDPQAGVLFLADDPAQSIYRFYSWREKGVAVVGRTRWLRVPYRNTYEIYQAAYQLIASDDKLLRSLKEEGVLVEPNLESGLMRHGTKPLIQRFENDEQELIFIRGRIEHMLQGGTDARQIAVLHRHNRGVSRLKGELRGTDVNVGTFHRLKGLEFESVFLCQLQDTLVRNGSDDEKSAERRLVYMAMTRAREQLYMGYQGKLPKKYSSMQDYVDYIY